MFKISTAARSVVCASALAVAFVAAAPVIASAAVINVSVDGARNDNGVVRCGLFNSPNGWPKAGQQFKKAEGKVSNGKALCQFTDIEPGTYAVALFHAEQGERQVEFGLLGIPKQGVAFSRNHSITFGAPSFEKASFTVDKAPVSLDIKLIY